MDKKKINAGYIITDIIASVVAWTLSFYYRKSLYEPPYKVTWAEIFEDQTYYISSLAVLLYWIFVYYHSGFYSDVYKKSRIHDLLKTISISFGFVMLLSIILFSDDLYPKQSLIKAFIVYFAIHTTIIAISRLGWITLGKWYMKNGFKPFSCILLFETLDLNILQSVQKNLPIGYRLTGYVNHYKRTQLQDLTYLGDYTQLNQIVKNHQIDDVLILSENKHIVIDTLHTLAQYNVTIRTLSNINDLVLRNCKINKLENLEFYEIFPDLMPLHEKNIKQTLDYTLSIIMLILLSPMYLIVSILVKVTSPGPIFYTQERIGKNGEPFKIIKFRTMIENAESNQPMLSSLNDKRITPLGKILRKWRIDEFPQFVNVLKGEMSLVGYRAERKYFIDQITQRVPYYQHLYRAKPGLTSLGMVKYGYAENVDEMIERLKFDIIYIENMSLSFDFKILFKTLIILLQGRGR